MYHRLQRLPLSRTLESPTPECFLPVQIRMPQRRQREQAPGSGANSGATSCAGAGAGAILDPVSHAPIELRKDMGSTAPPL